ncbi:Na+/H+ antiporter NhaC [Flagellimonas pacifica]|uniref:Transporter, NhaC family n=1 Tax=Flagellimonas pacifica TaxID=1247520 RepID=A0A285MCF3_9FLAO|nr:Na+/H+ antiporter NhaC [Allomuricauda parva]SNY94862.1 transporter, NhaC family [Allomuricauda parva]
MNLIQRKDKLIHSALPVLFLLALIVYGLVLRPYFFDQPTIPLEIIFLCSSFFATAHLYYLGYTWDVILANAIKKLTKGLPTILILFAIGIVIGSWIVSGTIPMFVYYGIELVNPKYIYVLAFIVPIFFSMFTGTSYGSVGTIGVVIFGVAMAIDANLHIVAGAVIGGAFFGDKMSPLSDTTNIAALAAEIDLFDHINSMLYTTLPSAIIAACIYTAAGFIYPVDSMVENFSEVEATLNGVASIFNFNVLLLAPVLIVLLGSIKKLPTIPVLLTSSLVACILGLLVQSYTFDDIVQSVYKGFDTNMAVWQQTIPENISTLFNRGGMYALNDAIIIALFVFLFIGILDTNKAIPRIVDRVFSYAKTKTSVILSSLFASGVTNSMTGNQYATSFIVGEAFKSKYDKLGISRKVLSRSLEDYGTMIESLIPWHPTALFMVSVMGVSVGDYWNWQLLSLINLIIAPLIAILGIGCFYKNKKVLDEKKGETDRN